MDPIATQRLIQEVDNDFLDAVMCCDDLIEWLERGGFKSGLVPFAIKDRYPNGLKRRMLKINSLLEASHDAEA